MSHAALARASLVALTLAAASACQSGAAVGTPCARASACASGLVCRFGACRAECTANRDCPGGTACLLLPDGLGACGIDADLGCEGGGVGRVCPSGLVCAVDRCEATCSSDTDCPSDGACLGLASGARFCFDTRTGGDAGLPDAGAIDAGTQGPSDADLDTGELDANVDAAPPLFDLPAQEVCLGANGGCALGSDARVYCWGSSVAGRLGDGSACAASPTRVATPQVVLTGTVPLEGVSAIACAGSFACAYASGHVWCWGANDQGQLGRGTTGACASDAQPVQTATGTLVISGTPPMSAAGQHVCALDLSASALWCWGADDVTIDGSGTTTPLARDVASTWLTEPGMLAPTQIALAARGACLNGALSNVRCWGDDDRGQAGTIPSPTPVGPPASPVTGAWRTVVAGRAHRCLLSSSGQAQCFGDGDLLQLGSNFFASDCVTGLCVYMPQGSIPTYYDRLAASGDGDTTCGVVSVGPELGHVLCWGANDAAQAGVATSSPVSALAPSPVVMASTGAPLADVRRIALGPTTGCAIDAIGVLSCWGDTDFDPTTPGTHTASAVTILVSP